MRIDVYTCLFEIMVGPIWKMTTLRYTMVVIRNPHCFHGGD